MTQSAIFTFNFVRYLLNEGVSKVVNPILIKIIKISNQVRIFMCNAIKIKLIKLTS